MTASKILFRSRSEGLILRVVHRDRRHFLDRQAFCVRSTCLPPAAAPAGWHDPKLFGRAPALMPRRPGERYDFFLSRRVSVATIAQGVTYVLKENGYRVRTQDYDIPITANFIEEMHKTVKDARDLVVLAPHFLRASSTSFRIRSATSPPTLACRLSVVASSRSSRNC